MTAKDLKNAILQEAVQGKLVPQIADEGNARDLLERIRKEKAKLIKEGKLKKEKPLPEITQDEIPFDIPDSWCWTTIGNIAFVTKLAGFEYSSTIAPNLLANGIPLFKGKNIQNSKVIYDFEGYIPEKISDELERSQITRKCLLTPYVGSIGNIGIHNREGKYHLGSNVGKIETYCPNYTIDEYVFFYLKSPQGYDELTKFKKSTAQESISIDAIRQVYIPLPPLAEQKRIVAAIEKLMPLVEEYGRKEAQLKDLNAQIGSLMKKAILQEAVQGKLVPQLADEGNAKDLLEMIRKEKAKLVKEGKLKKEKPLLEITQDEIPFDIPDSWCWCRLGEICRFLSRGKSPKYSVVRKYPVFAQKCNLKDGEISLDQAQFLDPDALRKWSDEYKILDGDILVNSTGTGTVMRTRLFKKEYLGGYPFVVPDSHVTVIRTADCMASKYVYYCCRSFMVQNYWEENLAGSTNQKELYIGVVEATPIPLPPLAEQKRIVAAIESMLPLCEKLGNEV